MNSLNSITEIENVVEYLPEDRELLGFLPLRNYYSTIDFKSINQIINNDKSFNNRNQFYIRIGRIQAFIKFLIQKYPDDYKYDEIDEKYIIMDEDYKKKDKARLLKLMAQERLKKQVEDLKEKVFKKIQPYVVIDENIILNDLPLLKKWISSKSCKIIIPLNVISVIDIQKNGNAKINIRAREAIRYLEQYSHKPNKFLKIQKNDEKQSINYEEYYLFKDQDKNNLDNDEDLDLSVDDVHPLNEEKIKNIFSDSNDDLIFENEFNRNSENNDRDNEIAESISYYRNHQPSRKYKSLIECFNYFNEKAKKEIEKIISINNENENGNGNSNVIDNEKIYPLILVTNNRILIKYHEIFKMDFECMTLQNFIKYMAKKRQERRNDN